MIQKIGSMVYQLRKKMLVSRENLGRGLISGSELARIEYGEKEGDCFLMSALFQRLGKSLDQFEMSVTNDEYTLILLRAFIQESMESKDYDRARELLDEYEETAEKDKLIHLQYLQMLRAVLDYLRDENVEKAICELRTALEPSFKDAGCLDWTGYCLYIQEIQILLLIAFLEMERGELREAVLLLEKLYNCIDVTYTSEVSRVQVYPKCCYLLALVYQKSGMNEKAMEISEKGMECLKNSASLIFIEDLLEIQQICNPTEEREEQRQAIRFAYDLVNYAQTDEFIIRLLFSGIHQEVTLSNELLREVRKAQKWSQDELSFGICTRETLARMENGRTPRKNHLMQLLTKLGIDREKCYASVVTDDWEVLELVRDYKRNNFMENQEDALSILADIESKLDLSIPANKQYVELANLRYQIKKKQISNKDAIKKLNELLLLTMPEYEGKLFRVPYREEFFILNRMALCLKKSGKHEEAIALYEEILQKYQSSKVGKEYHANAMRILYLNYLELLETSNYLERAEEIGRRGLGLMIKYQRGDFVAMCLANLACVYEKSETQAKNSLVLPCLASSYTLLNLFRLEKKSKKVKQYINIIKD